MDFLHLLRVILDQHLAARFQLLYGLDQIDDAQISAEFGNSSLEQLLISSLFKFAAAEEFSSHFSEVGAEANVNR
jgi:hypothetical protein